MRAGNLREVINIYTYSQVTNELGEKVKSKVLFKTVRAERKNKGGKEIEVNEQLTPIQTVQFNIRFDDSIDETMVIEYLGKYYNIRYIEPIKKVITQLITSKSK